MEPNIIDRGLIKDKIFALAMLIQAKAQGFKLILENRLALWKSRNYEGGRSLTWNT